MKKLFTLIISLLISGCIPYDSRTDLSDCLAVGNYNSKISNEEIINSINTKHHEKIKTIIITDRTKYGSDDATECPATAIYDNGNASQGFITSTGRWGRNIEYKFLTLQEKKQQIDTVKKANQEKDAIKEINLLKEKKKFEEEFTNASMKNYPLKTEIYCYNKKTLEMYYPETCGIRISGNTGPTNLYDTDALTLNLMLNKNFNLKIYMYEPNPFLGIKVDIRSRKTNDVIMTKYGSYTDTVTIGN